MFHLNLVNIKTEENTNHYDEIIEEVTIESAGKKVVVVHRLQCLYCWFECNVWVAVGLGTQWEQTA